MEGGPYDIHTMVTHKKMPGRLTLLQVMDTLKAMIMDNRGKDQQQLCLSIMVTSLILQLMRVILKPLLYLRLNRPGKHISLKLLNQWFTEKHHLLMGRILMMSMTKKSGS